MLEKRIVGNLGQRVLIGFIDTGLDCDHPEFRDSKGRSRIVALYDTSDSLTNCSEFPWGRVYTYAEIISKDVQKPMDDNCHGTAVASVAAGSTLGIARDALLIPVKLPERFNEAQILDGINFIKRVSQELRLPFVVNVSSGYVGYSAECFTFSIETQLDELYSESVLDSSVILRGIAIAAGNIENEGTDHYLPPQAERRTGNSIITVSAETTDSVDNDDEFTVHFFSKNHSGYKLWLTTPNDTAYGPLEPDSNQSFAATPHRRSDGLIKMFYDRSGTCSRISVIVADSDSSFAGSGSRRNKMPKGDWRFTLGDGEGPWSAILWKPKPEGVKKLLAGESTTTLYTMLSGALSQHVIATGSVNGSLHRKYAKDYPQGHVSSFSPLCRDIGPISKPDVYAIGAPLTVAVPITMNCDPGKYGERDGNTAVAVGTSLAAAKVAGTLAILAQEFPEATFDEIKKAVLDGAKKKCKEALCLRGECRVLNQGRAESTLRALHGQNDARTGSGR